jgi:hypothetical protein
MVAIINNKPLLIMRPITEESWINLWCGFPTYGLDTGVENPDMKQLAEFFGYEMFHKFLLAQKLYKSHFSTNNVIWNYQ